MVNMEEGSTLIHENESPLSGLTVNLVHKDFYGRPTMFVIDDWWDRIQNTTWRTSDHHLAIDYEGRMRLYSLPNDDNVLLGTFPDGSEKLIHVSEIADFLDEL